MGREYILKHLQLGRLQTLKYKSPKSPVIQAIYPERNREQHATKLRQELISLKQKIESEEFKDKDAAIITLVGNAGFDFKGESAADKRSGSEVLISGRDAKDIPYTVLRIPKKGLETFGNKIDAYQYKINPLSNKPYNNDMINSIDSMRMSILKELWVGDEEHWPVNETSEVIWELWLRGGTMDSLEAKVIRLRFSTLINKLQVEINTNVRIEFSDRQVFLAKISIEKLKLIVSESDDITEIRPPSRATIQYFANEHHQNIDVDSIKDRLESPSNEVPRITVIDTGVSDRHPLLEKVIAINGLYTVDPTSALTSDYNGHGTEVCGIAAFNDLATVLLNHGKIEMKHAIESVRMFVDEDATQFTLWGQTTKNAVNTAESNSPNIKRIYNLSIGSRPNHLLGGKPSSWTATIDDICYNNGYGRLMTVAAGNVFPLDKDGYPNRNLTMEVDDPSNALNAICVGGYTQLSSPTPTINGFDLLAQPGELSPHSCTGRAKWAIKPDVVAEAGNIYFDGEIAEYKYDGLCPLTTGKNYITKPFVNSCQTSIAAPAIARMLAIITAENPNYKPATIRGLLIHSSNWTEAMKAQFPNKIDRIRACGYGVPDLAFACKSAKSAVTLIDEGEVRCSYHEEFPGKRAGKFVKSPQIRDMCFYKIPWPKEELLILGSVKVVLKVTLSYFIEPNPRQSSNVYEGASLDWDLQGVNETHNEFLKRINKEMREKDEKGFKNEGGWEIGSQLRSRGSVQSDRWEGTAAELASREHIAVYPQYGWWKYNTSKRPNPVIPFTIIVSVVTESEDINLYISIENLISVPIDWN